MPVQLTVDGVIVDVDDEGTSLLDVLRRQCGKSSVKDGCAPQGQCGCCTVLVDGQPRVSCVTPVRRVAGRSVTTPEGLPGPDVDAWADAFTATGGSQCGFCTPGIVCRFTSLRAQSVEPQDRERIDNALAAHLCRCTGWQTIVEAYGAYGRGRELDAGAASLRATIEGGTPQQVGPHVARGEGGFSADTVPPDALVAVPGSDGSWVVAETVSAARELAGKVQGRRSSVGAEPPIPVPDGRWDRTLRTNWVEPAHLETETTWCEPGGDPSTLLANGGAFGGKTGTELGDAARRLAAEHGRTVCIALSREDSVRLGPKRPPISAGVRTDGTGHVVVARTPGIADRIRSVAPDVEITEVDLPGPPTSASLRGAGWAEAAVLLAALGAEDRVVAPNGAEASARIDGDGIHVSVEAGSPLDEVVLRSYCIGAAHMAYGWVTSEQLTVDPEGIIHDLTIRSFGIVRSRDMPAVHVEIVPSTGVPMNGSDAVLAAVAAATWRARGHASAWPTG